MPVPSFQRMMRPILAYLEDGQAHAQREIAAHIAAHFKLSEAECAERLPSGQQTYLDNRVGWSRTHLKNACLIEYVSSGVSRITERGRKALRQYPDELNLNILDQFEEHYHWRRRPRQTPAAEAPAESLETPEEQMAQMMTAIEARLAAELLDVMKQMKPARFEHLVVDLLLAMGYGGSRDEAGRVTQQSGDEGIDGVINEDRLGLDIIYVQAKRWQDRVGRQEVQRFVGALAGKQAHKGIFITTSDFTDNAFNYAQSVAQKVILINGQRLASLMIEHGIGVSTRHTYTLKRIDHDYFDADF